MRPAALPTLTLAFLATFAGFAPAASGPQKYLNKPDDWFAGAEARRVAANILSYQADLGGWPKNIDTTRAPFTGDRKELKPTFDNDATTDELRFLARIYNATRDETYRKAFEKGLDYILGAQYPTGGWPQFFPPGGKYHRHITFNDNAMVRLMEFLREVYGSDRYAFVDDARRQSARRAFDRGVQCILKCQIKVGDKLTAWCAQHDEKDYRPRPGRTYELISLSGAESVGIVRLLMSLDDPSPDVVRAVAGAVAWFESAKLTGIRQVVEKDDKSPKGTNKVVVKDPDAPPMWARFYEIGTNRPIFSDRDGVAKHDLAEIGYERRNGYAWLGYWPQKLLEVEYPAWKKKRADSPKPSDAKEPPTEWVDADTGHRVVRLSREPGSASLYFHQNAYSTDGRKLVITTPGGLSAIDLRTREVEKVAEGRGVIVVGRKTGQVYYTKAGTVYATDLDTKATREVVKLPGGRGTVTTLNADETLLAGAVFATDPSGKTPRPEPRKLLPQRERMFPGKEKLTPEEEASVVKEERLARRLADPRSMALFTVNARTGEVQTFGYSYAWLNHLQFSPTDPTLLMFCHEGTWHEVDRIWTIRSDGTGMRLMHRRTMDMEIAGHEFWGPDGKTIWYDLQTPRSKEFWLAGVNVESGEKVRYKIERDQWSVHYNVSPDGKRFAGDGGDPGQVAFAKDGQWIHLYTPKKDRTLEVEKLVNLARHNYRLEPNVTFTPDGKWVVFRSNMHGPTHVYAVEVEKAK
jgi:PelA/Pel-15E family pectate lyase